jgi:hypothetical protein
MSRVCCPVCWREVDVTREFGNVRIIALHLNPLFRRCEMSYMPVPPALLREIELEQTATRVMQLAADLRDDVENVWQAVNHATPDELREWLLIALAAVDVDREPSKLFGWIEGVAA